jgi:hypothetical protein
MRSWRLEEMDAIWNLLTDSRQRRIREVAYFKAQQRGFLPGFELQDWLEAEREVDEAARPLPSY